MSLTKRKNCPICNSKKFTCIFERKYSDIQLVQFLKRHFNNNIPLKFLKNKYYKINECLNCKGLFQKYIFDQKFHKRLYENFINKEKSKKKKDDFSVKDFQTYFNEMKSIEKNFKRKPINIKILEIGAGWGSWSLFAKACNFKIEAIEVSSSRLSYIKKNNIKIYNNINKINKKKYDLIYLDQTLEHLESPYKTLNIIKKILSKNGLLIIKVPSGLFTKKKLFNDYIFHEDELIPLEHINIFNYKTFNYISKKYNFRFKFLFSKYPPNSILYYKDLIKNFYYYLTNKMVIFKNSN